MAELHPCNGATTAGGGRLAVAGPGLPIGELARYHHTGPAWVVANVADDPVTYLIADRVDGNLHVEQVSAHPDSARRGLGRSLLDHPAGHAASESVPALKLTTFAQVPLLGTDRGGTGAHDGGRCRGQTQTTHHQAGDPEGSGGRVVG